MKYTPFGSFETSNENVDCFGTPSINLVPSAEKIEKPRGGLTPQDTLISVWVGLG
jgi:hypothetical protein